MDFLALEPLNNRNVIKRTKHQRAEKSIYILMKIK